MTGEAEQDSPHGAIDADFEPAPAADYVVPSTEASRSGPGWMSLGILGALSAGALGLSAYTLNQGEAGSPDVSSRFNALQSAQDTNAEDIAAVRESVKLSEERMAAEIDALLSGGDDGEGLEALVAELETVSTRLDEAMSGTSDASVIAALQERLVALEDINDAKAINPRQVNSVIAPLRARIDALETENAEFAKTLEAKTKALESVNARIEDMEFALQSSSGGEGRPDANAFEDIRRELDDLKEVVERTETSEIENRERVEEVLADLQKAGDAEQKADEAQEAASAALALSRIEAAAREGRSFHAAYKQLSEAMPGNAAVERLSSIARSGAPTMSQLTQRFEGDRDAALDVIDTRADDGWGWTRQVFGGGVKVRRANTVSGPRELFQTASDALRKGDLEAAMRALQDLPDEPKAVMEDWLSSAQARLELQDALDDIGVRLIGRDR